MSRQFYVICSMILLISFALLSKFEDRQIIRNVDFATTVKVQDRIDKSAHLRLAAFVDNTMEGATFFAGPEFTSIIVLILTVVAVYDWKNKKGRWKAALIPLTFIVIVLAEIYGKTAVHHPSPPFSMIKHTTSVFPANYINEQFSYPSGHTARAIFVSLIAWIAFGRKKWVGVGLVLYVFLVSVSRIYLGLHWLSDILGGGLLGSAMSIAVLAIL